MNSANSVTFMNLNGSVFLRCFNNSNRTDELIKSQTGNQQKNYFFLMSSQKHFFPIQDILKNKDKYLKTFNYIKNGRFFFIMATHSIYLKLYQCLRLN